MARMPRQSEQAGVLTVPQTRHNPQLSPHTVQQHLKARDARLVHNQLLPVTAARQRSAVGWRRMGAVVVTTHRQPTFRVDTHKLHYQIQKVHPQLSHVDIPTVSISVLVAIIE